MPRAAEDLRRLPQPTPLAALLCVCVSLLGVPFGSACGGECRDADGDGRGPGCERGDDCDDDDPRLGERCDDQARVCAEDSGSEGCPCLAGARRRCFAGPEGSADVGVCRAGERHCAAGAWSACEGEVLPDFETCNARDDDCDGRSDERVQSPCGGCDPECTGGVWGQLDAPFEPAPGLELTAAGELTLARAQVASSFVYVPSAGDGTLSKIDAERAAIVARYALPGEPEHVALDHRGDVFVLSPAHQGRSQLTKVATELERCVDRDGDGLDTSGGEDERLPAGDDDCVLWSVPVGEDGELAHALAIDGTNDPDVPLGGHAWVALERTGRLLQLHGDSGELLTEIPDVGIAPHAGGFDPWGSLWLLDREGILVRVDLRVTPPTLERIEAPLGCYELESLSVDVEGTLLMTGLACEDVASYDPATRLTEHLHLRTQLDVRASAVLGDEVWVTHTGGLLSRLSRFPLALEDSFTLDADDVEPVDTVALGADALGRLWAVSTFGGPRGTGVVSRFDPAQQEVTAQLPVGLYPRAQGDISGGQRIAVLAAEASAEHVFGGCAVRAPGADGGLFVSATRWRKLHVAADVPRDAQLLVEVRHAASSRALDAAPYAALGTLPDQPSPFTLELPEAGVLQVRVTLRAAGRIGAPRLVRVGVEWGCLGPE